MTVHIPADGRCLGEVCCWIRVRMGAVERDAVLLQLGEEAKNHAPENLRGRIGRTPNQIAEQWENLGKQEVE